MKRKRLKNVDVVSDSDVVGEALKKKGSKKQKQNQIEEALDGNKKHLSKKKSTTGGREDVLGLMRDRNFEHYSRPQLRRKTVSKLHTCLEGTDLLQETKDALRKSNKRKRLKNVDIVSDSEVASEALKKKKGKKKAKQDPIEDELDVDKKATGSKCPSRKSNTGSHEVVYDLEKDGNFEHGSVTQLRRKTITKMPPRKPPQFSDTLEIVGQTNTSPNQRSVTATSATSMAVRKGRGKTKGVYLSKILDKVSKVEVIFPPGGLKPIGNWSAQWGTELGVICRNNANVTCKKWKHIAKEDKEHIYKLISDKFDMDMDAWNVRAGLDQYLQGRFRGYRHDLHKHFKKHLPKEQALRHPPTGVSLEDWKECCEQFADEKFQDKSRKNSMNRKKQKVTHCTGSKSFIRLRYEKADPITKAPLDRVETYKATHFIDGKEGNPGTWTKPEAEENYERMIELQKQTHPDGRPFTADEICDTVLGIRPGYVRGLGYGEPSRPSSALAYRNHVNLEDARRRATDAEKRAHELALHIESQNKEIQSQKERMDAMLAEQSSMRLMMETLILRIESNSNAMA